MKVYPTFRIKYINTFHLGLFYKKYEGKRFLRFVPLDQIFSIEIKYIVPKQLLVVIVHEGSNWNVYINNEQPSFSFMCSDKSNFWKTYDKLLIAELEKLGLITYKFIRTKRIKEEQEKRMAAIRNELLKKQ